MFNTGNPWKDRAQAALVHLGLSLAVSAVAAALVFFVWYPYPYGEISGGRELFFLVVAVDVVLGPLLTFAVFNRNKPMKELKRDLAIIVALQFAALGYGLWTVAVARPVYLVFEYDRYRSVHAVEIDEQQLALAPETLRSLPWTGPTLLGLRPLSNQEMPDATNAALGGFHLALQAKFWQPYAASHAEVLKEGKSMTLLRKRFIAQSDVIDKGVMESGRAEAQLLWLPLHGRKVFWTVLVDSKTAEPLAFIPLDSF